MYLWYDASSRKGVGFGLTKDPILGQGRRDRDIESIELPDDIGRQLLKHPHEVNYTKVGVPDQEGHCLIRIVRPNVSLGIPPRLVELAINSNGDYNIRFQLNPDCLIVETSLDDAPESFSLSLCRNSIFNVAESLVVELGTPTLIDTRAYTRYCNGIATGKLTPYVVTTNLNWRPVIVF